MLDYLPWVIAGMALVLAVTAVLVAARAAAFGRDVLAHLQATSRREASSGRYAAQPAPVVPSAPTQSADGRGPTPQQVVDWAREGFTSYGRRLQEIEDDLDLVMRELSRREGEVGPDAASTRSLMGPGNQGMGVPDAGVHGPKGPGGPGAPSGSGASDRPEASPWTPPVSRDRRAADGQPVEIRDGLIVPSRSLAAMGSLVTAAGAEPALLYLNDSVEIDHLSQNRWAQFFDFGGGEPYRRYRTVEPSKVEWNPATEQGRLIQHGRVEVV